MSALMSAIERKADSLYSLRVFRLLTWAAPDFRSAKALFVLRQSVISSPYCMDRTPAGRSHGNPHPTTRIHCHAWRCGSCLAARGTGAAAGFPADHRDFGYGDAFSLEQLYSPFRAAAA